LVPACSLPPPHSVIAGGRLPVLPPIGTRPPLRRPPTRTCRAAALARNYRLIEQGGPYVIAPARIAGRWRPAGHPFTTPVSLAVCAAALGVLPAFAHGDPSRRHSRPIAESAARIRPLLPVGREHKLTRLKLAAECGLSVGIVGRALKYLRSPEGGSVQIQSDTTNGGVWLEEDCRAGCG
jgi:hypothetical protein